MVLEIRVAHASILLLLHTVFEFHLVRLQNQWVVMRVELWLRRNVHTLVLYVVRRFAIEISLLAIHVRRYGHRCAFKIAFGETFLFEWRPDIWLIRVLIGPQRLHGFFLVQEGVITVFERRLVHLLFDSLGTMMPRRGDGFTAVVFIWTKKFVNI